MAQQYFEVEKGFKIGQAVWLSGAGSPSGADAAAAHIGSFWTDETNGKVYRKETTGWEAQASETYVDDAIAAIPASTNDDANIQAFIGKSADGVEMPTYSSTGWITQNGSLEDAIGELDTSITQIDTTVSQNFDYFNGKLATTNTTGGSFSTGQVVAKITTTGYDNCSCLFSLVVADDSGNATKHSVELLMIGTNFDYQQYSKLIIGTKVDYTLSFNLNNSGAPGYVFIEVIVTSATATKSMFNQMNIGLFN